MVLAGEDDGVAEDGGLDGLGDLLALDALLGRGDVLDVREGEGAAGGVLAGHSPGGRAAG